jgi:hypothetical protein
MLNEFIPDNKPLSSPKVCHLIYRKLSYLIDTANLVSEHYLVIDFGDEFLDNVSYESAVQRWRELFNSDLEQLNNAIKAYLQALMKLSLKGDSSLLNKKYNLGCVDPCGFLLLSTVLNTKIHDNQTFLIQDSDMINLETYQSKVTLQKELRDEQKFLIQEYERLKSYILKNYTLKSLL